jgi:hypothetical protein
MFFTRILSPKYINIKKGIPMAKIKSKELNHTGKSINESVKKIGAISDPKLTSINEKVINEIKIDMITPKDTKINITPISLPAKLKMPVISFPRKLKNE